MAEPSATSIQLILSHERSGGRLMVALEPFLAFDIDMTHRLQNLVDRWSDKAVPGRASFRPGADRFGR